MDLTKDMKDELVTFIYEFAEKYQLENTSIYECGKAVYPSCRIHILKSKLALTDVTQVLAQNVQIFGRIFVKTVPIREIKSNMKKRVVNDRVVC